MSIESSELSANFSEKTSWLFEERLGRTVRFNELNKIFNSKHNFFSFYNIFFYDHFMTSEGMIFTVFGNGMVI